MVTQGKTITMTGGCHCGEIRYTCAPILDPSTGTLVANRCNCSFCQKLGHMTNLPLDSGDPNAFKLLHPASREGLGGYQHGAVTMHRYYCVKCGVHVWREGTYEMNGKTIPLLMVNLSTADQPQEGIDLKDVKMRYVDGLHDNWMAGYKDEPWSGGLV